MLEDAAKGSACGVALEAVKGWHRSQFCVRTVEKLGRPPGSTGREAVPDIYTFSCTQLSVEQAQEHDKQASGDVCKHGPQAHPSSSITPRAIEKYPSRILYLSFPHSITIF